MNPEQLGKYRVVRQLGQGAMGTVYLAEDPHIGRQVAIKVMKSAGEEERLRFLHEARIVGRFSHPNIVVLHDFGFQDEQPYLVMELVEGEGLDVWLKRQHPLEAHLKVADGLCAALEYAHARDVLHRDLKPSNVQVLSDGCCKLMDFGIARGGESLLTATGTVMGTPAYIAPEILESAQYSIGSDVYATGVVLYEMLAQRNPFLAPTVAATLNNVLHIQPEPISHVRPDVPPELGQAIMACIEKDPVRRPTSLAPLLEAIRTSPRAGGPALPASATQSVVLPPRAGSLPTQVQPLSTAGPSRNWPAAVKATIVVLAVVGVLWFILSSRHAPVVEPPSAASPAAPLAPGTPTAISSESAGSPARPSQSPLPAAARPQVSRLAPSATPLRATPTAAVPAAVVTEERPSPAPVAAATLLPPGNAAPTASDMLPAVGAGLAAERTEPEAPPPPKLGSLSRRAVRRGPTVTLQLRGSHLRSEQHVQVRQGSQPATGIRVARLEVKSSLIAEVTLVIDEDVPLGRYSVVMIDANGAVSNPLDLEVVL